MPSAGTPESEVANYEEIDLQSTTTAITHQPGDIYEGGSGFAGQILLITDFSDVAYMKTDGADTVGRTTVVKVDFPAGRNSVNPASRNLLYFRLHRILPC